MNKLVQSLKKISFIDIFNVFVLILFQILRVKKRLKIKITKINIYL